MPVTDSDQIKKKKLLLLQSLNELHKNAEDLWKTQGKLPKPEPVDFNYFYSKYMKYLRTGKTLYGKKVLDFKITIADGEYKKLAGLKKIITEMGLFIVFIKNDVGNLIDENKRLKAQLKKYKSQAMAIQKIT